MSFMDKIKGLFSGGSSDADAHAGQDHSGADHTHEPVAPPTPPADAAGMSTSEAAAQEGEDRAD
jgi:hypothetical protein